MTTGGEMKRYPVAYFMMIFAVLFLLAPGVIGAYEESLDYAQVRRVVARETSSGVWRFDVTLRHDDTGWDHYADEWQVLDAATGDILGTRKLAHPHVDEQPFTRSQSGIAIPPETSVVIVRGKCNVHGFGGREVEVDLTRSSGDGYEVNRR
jgi:hypothetical protein